MARHPDFDRYVAACNFPGMLDEAAVERHLAAYCAALGVRRAIVRLRAGWTLDAYPDLARNVDAILSDFRMRSAARDARAASDALDASAARAALDASAARDARAASDALDARAALDARDASAARDARDARDALRDFTSWCLHRRYWWYDELSWVSTTWLGAKTNAVANWSQPLFEAYVHGAWVLYWTDTTLYWVAKPRVHVKRLSNGVRRLHRDDGPAVESDIEPLYFVRGVMVPGWLIERPDDLTAAHIDAERNAEVRRVMLARFGAARWLAESGAKVVDEAPADHPLVGLRTARLLRKDVPDDEPIVMVDLLNSTPEPDGSTKRYQLRVDPNAYGGEASRNVLAAVASTWRLPGGELAFRRPADYAPGVET